MNNFDGFSINLIVEHDLSYSANFIELPEVKAQGSNPEEALEHLRSQWKLYKENCLNKGIDIPVALSLRGFSGIFNVRIPKELHRELSIEAQRNGMSLNSLIVQKLSAMKEKGE